MASWREVMSKDNEMKMGAWIAYYFKINPLQLEEQEFAQLAVMAEYISKELQKK